MELKETLKIRDREQFKKKDRDRDFSKRRRVENNRSTHSSDEEYFEEEGDETRMSQLRRGFHTQRSSPVLRDAVDEVLGVPIPRRARSASTKKLHEHQNSGSGDRKSMPSSDAGSPIGSGSASPPYSGASMKKKMKCIEPRTRVLSCAFNSKSSSLVQNDIEIEVAEALFDLMTQSHSQSQPSNRAARVYRDGTTAGDELKGLNAERGKVENDAFKVRNEESVKANSETILFGPMNNNKGGEKEKVRDEPAQELVRGDGFVDRGKVGSPKESESSSCVKRNACDIQDPTLTKADYAARLVESKNKKEARIMIDLMALPSLPPSPERNTLPGIVPKVTPQDVRKKSEVTHKIGVNSDSQFPNLNLEKKRRHHGISSVSDGTSRQPHGRKESNIQSPASLSSFPIGMGSWPCVLPHPGYMPSLGARSSMTMQPPQFKFVEPRTKRCTTHRLVADNIHLHQLLVTKSLSSSSGPTTSGVVSTLYGTKPLSLKSMVPTQRLTPGKDKRSDVTVAAGADVNPATGGNSVLLQQATNQALAHNFMNSGFTLALGQHQTTMMAPANSSGGPTQSNSSRKIPSNSFPEAQLTQVTFNQQNPLFPSNEAAASYMAMLQSGGHPIPIPTNVSMPSFKSGTSFLNSSYYSPPMFNIPQIQHPPSKKSQPPTGDNKHSQQPEKNSINNAHPYSYHVGSNKHSDIPKQGGSKSRAELAPQHFPLPFSSNLSSMTQNSTIFKMLPELSWNGSNKASEGKSQTDSKSENPFLAGFYHQQQMQQQLVLKGGASSAAIQPDYLPFLPKWDNFPRATTAQEGSSHQSRVNGTQLKSFQGKNNSTTVGNTPSAQGHHPVVINSQPVVVSSLIAGQRNNASAVLGLASQETEGSSPNGGSTPACRRVVPSILSSCANQLSEIKYG